jgi:MaoC like domain
MSHTLPLYRVQAANTAADSENKIHDDRVAAEYGFRGGLVPGVTVYGYMTVPIVDSEPAWLERGSMHVRFLEPVYDGEEIVVRAEVNEDGSMDVTAERDDGTVCAKGHATTEARLGHAPSWQAEHPLPPVNRRPVPSPETLIVHSPLGTVIEKLSLFDASFLDLRNERLPIYHGSNPPAHPAKLLQFSNEMLVRNFQLGPWIHVASEINNWSVAWHDDVISARGVIHDLFERKGHEFVVVDVILVANGERLVQTVRHTAIYRPRAN